MDSLLMYGNDSEESDNDDAVSVSTRDTSQHAESSRNVSVPSISIQQRSVEPMLPDSAFRPTLPPPPEDIFGDSIINSGTKRLNENFHNGRIRSFPHVEGNYALHVYIPVMIPSFARTETVKLLDKAMKRQPKLQFLEESSMELSSDDVGVAGKTRLSGEYHVSLSRTVTIRLHQIESITSMLRHKFSNQKGYLMEFGAWDVFTNDERTRTFLSLEIITAGLSELKKQVFLVDQVFKLHNLPTYYETPRPHISLAWALGDVSSAVKTIAHEMNTFQLSATSAGERPRRLWSSQVMRVDCKIGQRVYTVWKAPHP